jgi:hypothetical protein
VNELICVEKFEDFPQLGRFTLRDEGTFVCSVSDATVTLNFQFASLDCSLHASLLAFAFKQEA